MVRVTGLDGLRPSFATRTPDYVRLRRGQVQVLLPFHKTKTESRNATLFLFGAGDRT